MNSLSKKETNKRVIKALDDAIQVSKEENELECASVLNALAGTMHMGGGYMRAFLQMVTDFSANMLIIIEEIKKKEGLK
jgi:hypothetical protein